MLLKWCRGFCFHIYHWNFAINFFLYYLTGKKFRDRVICIIKNLKKSLTSCGLFFQNILPVQSSILLIRIVTVRDTSNVVLQNSNINNDNCIQTN